MLTRRRSAFAALVMALGLTSVSFVTLPAHAAPNDGRYQKSSEAMKKEIAGDCAFYGREFAKAEKEADKLAGTKAAKKYADAADTLWEAGVAGGCGWAS